MPPPCCKAWGESLSLYANLTPPKEELNTAIQSGRSSIWLLCPSPTEGMGTGVLAQLSQLFGWQEEEYLSLLEEAQRATSAKAMAAGYHRAGGMATGALLRFAGRGLFLL